jgi:hypothetical protein
MTHQAFDSQFFHEVQKPLHRSRGLDAHTHRAWQFGIKLPHIVAFVLQNRIHYLSRRGLQHRQRLLASVQITSYNSSIGDVKDHLNRQYPQRPFFGSDFFSTREISRSWLGLADARVCGCTLVR